MNYFHAMPYTFVHPAFVLPFKRTAPRALDSAALVMGSIVPDFDIIFRFSETRHHIFSYSAGNILFLILPIAVVLTWYMKWIMLPVYSGGSVQVGRNELWNTLLKTPQIILSALLGILVHLWLDNITHIDAVIDKAVYWSENLGRDPGDYQDFYLFFLYGPAIIGSFVGLLAGLWTLWIFRDRVIQIFHTFKAAPGVWARTLLLIAAAFALMKHIKAGVEEDLSFDSYIISITCGLMASFLLSPVLVYLQEKWLPRVDLHLEEASAYWYSIGPVLAAFYLLGQPHKEYLRVFAAKGFYLMSICLLTVLLMVSIRKASATKALGKITLSLLFIFYLPLALLPPMPGFLKVILLLQWVVLLLLHLRWMEKSRLHGLVYWLSSGVLLLPVAYYLPGKGGGPALFGILLVGAMAFARNQAAAHVGEQRGYLKWVKLLPMLELALLLILMALLHPSGILILLAGFALISLISLLPQTPGWLSNMDLLYQYFLPLCGLTFIASEYSYSYALLSACVIALLFPLMAARLFAHFSFAQNEKGHP